MRLILGPNDHRMYLFYSLILLFYFVALFPVIAYKRLRYRKPLGVSADRFG